MFTQISFVFKPSRFVYLGVVLSLSMTACSLREPDHFTRNKVQLIEERVTQDVSVAEFNDANILALANHYSRHGDGPLEVVVSYNPKSRSQGAMYAGQKAAEVAASLRAQGVENIDAHIMPVKDLSESKIMVSYLGYDALGPKDCELMPGLEHRKINANESYRMGCSVDTIFAKQIARPRDLLGQETSASTDGRRSANQVELYRTGVPNEPLEGESASE